MAQPLDDKSTGLAFGEPNFVDQLLTGFSNEQTNFKNYDRAAFTMLRIDDASCDWMLGRWIRSGSCNGHRYF